MRHLVVICPTLMMAAAGFTSCVTAPPDEPPKRGFAAVQAVLDAHCTVCHGADDPEGKLVLESFDTLMRGGQGGAAIVPGNAQASLLVKAIEGRSGKTGKNQFMPPGIREHLTVPEIALVRNWIDSGASPPSAAAAEGLRIPDIKPKVTPPRAIHALAYHPRRNQLALGLNGAVAWVNANSTSTHAAVSEGPRGNINALLLQGDVLYAGGGEPGIAGEIRVWDLKAGTVLHRLRGHRDAIHAMALAPDGTLLATGGYDQRIILWRTQDGEKVRELSGHSGAVFGLAFRADGKVLASASADTTVKLWSVDSGERLDTFSQPTKAQHVVAFSPDGTRLVAGGADHRIRMWSVSTTAREGSNALRLSQYGHEGAILQLAFSHDGSRLASGADDRTVKVWSASDLQPALSHGRQPDWPTALAFAGERLFVARQDGTLQEYPWKP